MGSPLRALRHCIVEAWDGLRRNLGLTSLTILSIGVSLYILGLFLLLSLNLNHFVDALGHEEQVQIYLKPDVDPEQIAALKREIDRDPAIGEARYVSGEEARRRFQETFPSLRDLSQKISGNPFPSAFELRLRDQARVPGAVDRIAAAYGRVSGVEEVRYDRGWVERLAGIVALVRRGGYGLGLLLALAAMVTVGAVIRLTVLARREEIEIMKLVGATGLYIRGPFLLGAAAQGLAGGGLGAALVYLTHRLVTRSELYKTSPFMAILAERFLPAETLFLLAAAGALLALVAATLSLRRAATFRTGVSREGN